MLLLYLLPKFVIMTGNRLQIHTSSITGSWSPMSVQLELGICDSWLSYVWGCPWKISRSCRSGEKLNIGIPFFRLCSTSALRLMTDRMMGMIGMIWMSMSGVKWSIGWQTRVAGRCRASRFPYAWVGCMKMATCRRRMGGSMGVGIKTSMRNPSNVSLKVPVHVAQGSCGMFTELHLLHMYILYPQPFGLVIS